jgi:class 3 adenylate cyclase
LSRGGRSYTRCAVGFIDTLGAKAFADSEAFLNALGYMVDLQQKVAEARPGDAVRTVYFSDNIGASIPLAGLAGAGAKRAVCQLLRLLAGIQLYYLRDFGILCRGGVAVGDCFHGQNMIFGPALVEAYLLEGTAVSPRIAVSEEVAALAGDDVVALLPPEPLAQGDTPVGAARAIDFLRAECPAAPARERYFAQLRTVIAAGLSRSGAAARTKWEWTALQLATLEATTAQP